MVDETEEWHYKIMKRLWILGFVLAGIATITTIIAFITK